MLPLVYGIPKSIYYVSKGQMKKASIIFYLKSFILWNFIFIAIAVILARFFPKVSNTLYNSWGFFVGQWIGIGWAISYMLSKKGRDDLNADFWDAMIIKNYSKTTDLPSRGEK